MMNRDRLLTIIDRLHLWYLGLLPPLGTLMVLARYGNRFPFLLFLGGVAAVSVYLVVTYVYDKPAQSVGWGVLALLDGPLFVLLSLRGSGAPWAFAVEGYLVDGTAVWIAILVLAMRSPLPSQGQRVASVGFMLAAIAATTSLFWPYIQEFLWGNWWQVFWLVVGIGEATAVRYLVLEKTEIGRSGDPSFSYLLPFLLIWLLTFFAGGLAYEFGWSFAG